MNAVKRGRSAASPVPEAASDERSPQADAQFPWVSSVRCVGLPVAVLPSAHAHTYIHTRELVHLMLDTLSCLGLEASAAALRAETGIAPNAFNANALRTSVLDGAWTHVCVCVCAPTLPLLREGDRMLLLLMVARQQYLELLEAGLAMHAVSVLQGVISPLHAALSRAYTHTHTHTRTHTHARAHVHGQAHAREHTHVQDTDASFTASSSAVSSLASSVLDFAASLCFPSLDTHTHMHARTHTGQAVSAGTPTAASTPGLRADVGRGMTPAPWVFSQHSTSSGAALRTDALAAAAADDTLGVLLFRSARPQAPRGVSPSAHHVGARGGDAVHDDDPDLWAMAEIDSGDSVADAPTRAIAEVDMLMHEVAHNRRLCLQLPRVSSPSGASIGAVDAADVSVEIDEPPALIMLGEQHSSAAAGTEVVTPLDDAEQRYADVEDASLSQLLSDAYLKALASLVVAVQPRTLYALARWRSPREGSRLELLHFLERRLRGDVVPPLRLPALLGQALEYQRSKCVLHNALELAPTLLRDHQCGDNTLPVRCRAVLLGHGTEVWNVAVSPDCTRVFSFDRDGCVLVWNALRVAQLCDEDEQAHRTFDDGSIGAAVFDAASTGVISFRHEPDASAPQSSNSSRMTPLPHSAAHPPLVLRIATSQVMRDALPAPTFTTEAASTFSVCAAAWSPDSSFIATVGTRSSAVAVWDAASGRLVVAFDTGAAGGLTGVAWLRVPASSGYSVVCGGAEGGVWRWQFTRDEVQSPVMRLHAVAMWPTPPILSLTVPGAPQGGIARRSATATESNVIMALCNGGSLFIVHPDSGAPVLHQDVSVCGFWPTTLCADSSGRFILISCIAAPPHPQPKPGGRTLGGQVGRNVPRTPLSSRVFDTVALLGNTSPSSLHDHMLSPESGGPAAVSPDASRTLTALLREGLLGATPDSTSGIGQRTVQGNRVADMQPVLDDLRQGSGFGQLVVWDARAAAPVAVYRGHSDDHSVMTPAFGAAQESVLASPSEDGSIHLWHRERATTLAVLRGHAAATNAVAFASPESMILFSASDDGSVRMWAPKAGDSRRGP